MGLIMNLNTAAVVLNSILLTVLFVMYLRILREVNTRFTTGLAIFAAVLLLQHLVQLYFFATMMTYYAGGVEVLVLVQNLLASVALLFLVFVTWSPDAAGEPGAAPAD